MSLGKRILVILPLVVLIITFYGNPYGHTALNEGRAARALEL